MSLPAPINWLQKVLPELKEEEPESIWGAVGLWDIPIVEQNIFGIPPLFTVVNTSLQKVWLELFPLVHYQFLKEYRFGNLLPDEFSIYFNTDESGAIQPYQGADPIMDAILEGMGTSSDEHHKYPLILGQGWWEVVQQGDPEIWQKFEEELLAESEANEYEQVGMMSIPVLGNESGNFGKFGYTAPNEPAQIWDENDNIMWLWWLKDQKFWDGNSDDLQLPDSVDLESFMEKSFQDAIEKITGPDHNPEMRRVIPVKAEVFEKWIVAGGGRDSGHNLVLLFWKQT